MHFTVNNILIYKVDFNVKIQGARSGLCDEWAGHFQENCSRNCLVVQTVWKLT